MESQEKTWGEKIAVFRSLLTKKPLVTGTIVILIIFIIFTVPSLFINRKAPSQSPNLPKIWRIIFSFDSQTEMLKVKSMTVKKGNAQKSPLQFSRYKLFVKDKDNRVLYEDAIAVTEFVDFQFVPPSNEKEVPRGFASVDSIVVIPYFSNADHIDVEKDSKEILRFNPVKSTAYNVISQVDAAPAASCEKIHIVFLKDSYQDINTYHQHADSIKNYMLSFNPYADFPQLFDFKTIDNSQNFGCSIGGQFNYTCLMTNQAAMLDEVLSKYPDLPQNRDYLKIIVLTDTNPGPGGLAGLTLGLGSQYGAFETKTQFRNVAVHELGGHAVGYLYDRYVANYQSDISQNPPIRRETPANSTTGVKSNCTFNAPNGESFWSQARSRTPNAYVGCVYDDILNVENGEHEVFYAPGPRNCSNPSAGTSESIMSAASACAASAVFDSVEEYWIKNMIIPHYLTCPTSTPTVPNAPTSTPTPTTPVITDMILGKVFLDNNLNTVLDTGEPGLSGVTVFFNGPGGATTTQTDATGAFKVINLPFGTYSLTKIVVNNKTITYAPLSFVLSQGITQTISPLPVRPDVLISPTPTPTLTPSPLPTPSLTPTSSSGGGTSRGGGGGSSSTSSDEEPVVFYTCHEVVDTRVVNGKPLEISRLQCDPTL